MNVVDILLVEDNLHDIEMIIEALSSRCITDKVLIFNDGVAALDYFFSHGGCAEKGDGCIPRLIILDLKLPKVSGLEILKRIKTDERIKHIPVVVFTSSNEVKDRYESYMLGANSYIVKPMDADAFSKFVCDIRLYWLSMNKTTAHDTA